MSIDPIIAKAYAHMDETNEAYSRGEETEAERVLRDAREGVNSEARVTTSEPSGPRKSVEIYASRKPVAGKTPRKIAQVAPPKAPEKAGKIHRKPFAPSEHPGNVAWREQSQKAVDNLKNQVAKQRRRPNKRKPRTEDLRNRALDLLGDRERRVIATGVEAIEIYRNSRHLADSAHTKNDRLPYETGPKWVGERIDLQVVHLVRGHISFPDWASGLMTDDWFAGLLEEYMPWELHGPWPGICEAEIDAMLDTKIDTGNERMLPGMKRAG